MNRTTLLPRIIAVAAIVAGALALGHMPAFAQHADHYVGSKAPKNSSKTEAKAGMSAVPRLTATRVYTVKGDEDWDELTGFGKDSGMAEMMTLMMVGGSGMEHMKMAPMKPGMKMRTMQPGMKTGDMKMPPKSSGLPVTATITPNPPVVGDNTLTLAVNDPSGKPVTGLKLATAVGMTSMDMGTARPKFVEKDGKYSTTVNFSMKGPWRVTVTGGDTKAGTVNTALDFNVGGNKMWAQASASKDAAPAPRANETAPAPTTKVATPAAITKETAPAPADKEATPAPVITEVTPSPAATEPDTGLKVKLNTPPDSVKVGKNTLDISILDKLGKPVTGAKVTGKVEMTSMDMGVTKPQAKEAKGGHYLTPVVFSMKGPWKVTLTVTPPKMKPFTKSFEFNVKK